jgi:recX family
MIIEKIQKNKLYLSNEEIIDISPSIKQRYGLKVGDDIESLYDDISYEASLEKGIFLLSLKDRTKKEIQMKLNEKYRNAKMVEKAVLKLIELGYIDDLNYAISYINSRKYGKQRITYNLLQKGLNKEKIEEAYSTIQNETEKDIEEEKLKKVILKNIKKDEKKLVQYLVRQGFELDNIFRKLREYKEFDGFEDFME